MTLAGFARGVVLSWGWRRRLTAFAAGALAALAMPPFGLWPILFISLPLAVWLIDGAGGRTPTRTVLAAAAIGWWFGFGYFLAGLWWLGAAFLVEADEFAWALPLGVLGLPAGLAFFYALGFGLARLIWSPGPARILAFAAGLAVAEWLRGHILTGFPWNSLGMALGQQQHLAQVASLVGLYGLTVLAAAILAAPATLADDGGRWRRAGPSVAGLVILAAMAGYGLWRVPTAPSPTVPGVALRIMQPNLPQDAKFRPDNREAILNRYLALSDNGPAAQGAGVTPAGAARGMDGVTHLVWPESAFPFLLARDPDALGAIAALLPPGAVLVTGAARAMEPLPGETSLRFFNAVQVVDDEGRITGIYDKVHLVPFGEYLPLDGLLRRLGLRQFVHAPGGFEAGRERTVLPVPGLPPVAALICYEAIFPGAVLPQDGTRPGVLLNVTNDAWFGETPGPYQHMAQARLRSIEEGIPLVRAANTGISAVVDGYGRIIASLPLGTEGVLDAPLPEALSPTIYARLGDVVFWFFTLSVAAGAMTARRRGRVGRDERTGRP
ncbi:MULTISPECIES: apolipoprotein N-acyltransferase [Chelatococcus]|uniref:Apolipoprotein N-acyltransferase n=1 Tax=Chelatococcus caeni TaxID=1348468 RepID=A0A840C357_9HYPH|nr:MULTISPECIES: apolipoprotein N-acyltransferase [Chelatococcus]ALA17329.1 acyltransferase [Chelatococcus sp. CO-6]MBB4016867.1 apolipoprotein N-acyltransferase [Chelatococcus caeni]